MTPSKSRALGDAPAGRESTEPSPREGQYETVFNRFPQPAWILDRATLRILAVNDAAIEHYGFPRDEFLGTLFTDLCPGEEALDVRQKLGQYAPSSGTSVWHQRLSSGESARVQAVWRAVAFERVPAILMTVEATPRAMRRLIQEAESGRTRLESLSRRLVEVQEAERSEIARELHDEVGQLLTGLKLLLSSGVDTQGNRSLKLRERERSEIAEVVNELIGRLRNLSMNLRPPMLDVMGLLPTLRWYFDQYTARTRVRVSLHETIAGARFPGQVEITAFRIIQEALMNVARHANTDRVDVEVRVDEGALRLVIEDQGHGFNPRMVLSNQSAGIIGMQERAHLVGGLLTLESAIAAGTRIAVVLPLPAEPRGKEAQDGEYEPH